MPLSLRSCLQVFDENHDALKEYLGEVEHINTTNSLDLIRARLQRNHELTLSSSGKDRKIFDFIPCDIVIHPGRDVEVEEISPRLIYFGDENSDTDIVYAVAINQLKKRVTVAFRGSVTSTDFQKDAMISLHQQPNPVSDIDSDQSKEIGVHHGFYDYLLRPRKNGTSKYEEIIGRVEALFLEHERHRMYKLYVTGHSLGGALATVFSLYAAAYAGSRKGKIPSPVSCMSVASPRVGDRAFQAAFCRLEELGHLRHLRIANDRDPVTLMPSATGKQVWARLSPVSYLAFKLIDNKFEEKENFCHTGVKLLLAKNKWELSFLGTTMISSESFEAVAVDADVASCDSGSSTSLRSMRSRSKNFKQALPDVALHFGNAYIKNLGSNKDDLFNLSLNDLYKEEAASIVMDKAVNK